MQISIRKPHYNFAVWLLIYIFNPLMKELAVGIVERAIGAALLSLLPYLYRAGLPMATHPLGPIAMVRQTLHRMVNII